jgi:hypothetical protein
MEVAGICALLLLQRLGEDVLGMMDWIEDLRSSRQFELLDFSLSSEVDSIKRTLDVADGLCQSADDGSISKAQSSSNVEYLYFTGGIGLDDGSLLHNPLDNTK